MEMFDGTSLFRRPGFTPPKSPLSRRLLVYFPSGAYSLRRGNDRPDFSDLMQALLEEWLQTQEYGKPRENRVMRRIGL